MADEVDGSARIRIELDDSGVPAEARALGDRIAAAVNGQIRGIGRAIERQLRTVRIQVQVLPDLARFEAELLAGLSGLGSISIPVSPDLARFDAQLLAGLRGLESINVPVAPRTLRAAIEFVTGPLAEAAVLGSLVVCRYRGTPTRHGALTETVVGAGDGGYDWYACRPCWAATVGGGDAPHLRVVKRAPQ